MSDARSIGLAIAVLDHQLIDWEGIRCGRVDDVEFEGEPGKELRVSAIVSGPSPWRARGRLVGRLAARLYPGDEIVVPWDEVEEVSQVVKLRSAASDLGLGSGEERLRPWIEKVPGS